MTDAWRAAVMEGGAIELERFSLPAPGRGEVLLRARTTLISPGTERAFFLHLANTNPVYPYYPGYSFAGEVIACGAGVDALQAGDRVVCAARHASHALVDASLCLKAPDELGDEEAVFFNLLAIAMQGARKARIELGEAVVALGAGLIGILAMRLAQLSGGLPVIGVDLDARRLELAREIGADATIVADDNLQENLRGKLGEGGAEVVIEATGAPDMAVSAFQLAANRGRVILLGSARGATERVNFYRDVHRKGLTVIGAHEIARPAHENSPGYWTPRRERAVCLDLLARRRVNTAPLVTHRYGWQDFSQAYQHLANWDKDALGILIRWA